MIFWWKKNIRRDQNKKSIFVEVDAETQEVVSNSGPEQQFCLFDHMWKFGTSSAIMQRSGSRTWSSSRSSGRGEVETLQFDRGGSDTARRGGVDVEWATCPATRMFCYLSGRPVSMCHHSRSFVAATDQTRSSSLSTKSTAWSGPT